MAEGERGRARFLWIAETAAAGTREHWRSAVGLVALLAAASGAIALLGAVGVLDTDFMLRRFGSLWPFAWVSVGLTVISFLIALAAATPLGLLRAYAPNLLRRRRGTPSDAIPYRRARELWGPGRALRVVGWQKFREALVAPAYGVTTGYVEAIRGTPFYVQMWLVYFGVLVTYQGLGPEWKSGIDAFFDFLRFPALPPQFYFAGLLALTLNTIGYETEVLRAGFQSVGQGQVDGAKAIGLRGLQVLRHVTLPQALRLVILPLTNDWISLLKTSSILSAIAVTELMFQSKQLGVNEGAALEAFVMVASMYLLINVTAGKTAAYLERRLRIPGLGTPASAPHGPRARPPPAPMR